MGIELRIAVSGGWDALERLIVLDVASSDALATPLAYHLVRSFFGVVVCLGFMAQ